MMDAQNFVDNYVLDRHNTHSYKWDDLEERFGSNDLISMWIADMEFKVPDQVIDDMVTRVKHGAFGYSSVSDEYYTAFSNWMENKYNFPLKKEWIRFSTGCVTSIAWMIHAFTKPADHCMILTPVYYPFFNVVTNNDYNVDNNGNTNLFNVISNVENADYTNSSNKTPNNSSVAKTIGNQSNGSGFNYLWVLLLIVIFAGAGVLIKQYKN